MDQIVHGKEKCGENTVDLSNFRQEARDLCERLPEIEAYQTKQGDRHDVLQVTTSIANPSGLQLKQEQIYVHNEKHVNASSHDIQTISEGLDELVNLNQQNKHFVGTQIEKAMLLNQQEYRDLYNEILTLITQVENHLSKAKRTLGNIQTYLDNLKKQ